MPVIISIINADATRVALVSTQEQVNELMPLIDKARKGFFKKGTMNAEFLKVLAAKNMLPDFNGPDSGPYPIKGEK